MHPLLIARVLGLFALLFAATLTVPVAVGLAYGEAELRHLLLPLGGALALGLVLWLSGGLGARLGIGLTPVDALFESASGLTTTGATVITGLDALPRSLLFYRQQHQPEAAGGHRSGLSPGERPCPVCRADNAKRGPKAPRASMIARPCAVVRGQQRQVLPRAPMNSG
jgi:hypothetical protein